MEPMAPMEQIEPISSSRGLGGWGRCAIGEEPHLFRPVFQNEEGNGPCREHQAANGQKSDLVIVSVGKPLHHLGADSAEDAHTHVDDAHGCTAILLEPMGNDDLMRDGAGEQIAHGIEEVESVVNSQAAGHLTEAQEGKEGKAGAGDDELALAEAGDQNGPHPEGEQRG